MNGIVAVLLAALVLLAPAAVGAQDARTALETAARASGAAGLKSIQVTGSGLSYSAGQAAAPGLAWPKFNVKSLTRDVNYDTASLRDDYVRTQAEDPPRGGGVQPVRGEARQILVVSGDLAWNVVADAPVPAPLGLAERQFQLWSTPHGVIKGAMANNGTVQGRTIAFAVPGRFSLRATAQRPESRGAGGGLLPNPVVGDLPVEIIYSEYKDFGGVKYPTRIRQSVSGFPDARDRRHRRAAECGAGDPGPGAGAAGHRILREDRQPEGGRRRLVRDGREPSQRGHRDAGPRDRRGRAAK